MAVICLLQVLANLYSVHMDQFKWTEPERFNPGRFLDDSGQLIGRERVIPFSIGLYLCCIYNSRLSIRQTAPRTRFRAVVSDPCCH